MFAVTDTDVPNYDFYIYETSAFQFLPFYNYYTFLTNAGLPNFYPFMSFYFYIFLSPTV